MDRDDDPVEYISKSQQKRDALALQMLGTQLTELSIDQINQLALPEELKSAVLDAKTIDKHGAKRRQLQYIGKLMRNVETDHIKNQLNTLAQQSAEAVNHLHKIEKWRDRFINEGDQALMEFLNIFPETDCQQIRLLIRNAKTEMKQQRPPKAYRKLFQIIKAELAK